MTWIVSLALRFSPYANPPTHSHSTRIEQARPPSRSSRSRPRRPRRSPAGCCSSRCCCCSGCWLSAGALWVDWLVCAEQQLPAQVSRPSCCCRQLLSRQLRWRAPAHSRQLLRSTQQASESSEGGSGAGSVSPDLEMFHTLVTDWVQNVLIFGCSCNTGRLVFCLICYSLSLFGASFYCFTVFKLLSECVCNLFHLCLCLCLNLNLCLCRC